MSRMETIEEKQIRRQKAMLRGRKMKDWLELPLTKEVLKNMNENADYYLSIIDNPASMPDKVEEAIEKRRSIKWFLKSLDDAIRAGEQAAEKLVKQENRNKELTGGGKEKNK